MDADKMNNNRAGFKASKARPDKETIAAGVACNGETAAILDDASCQTANEAKNDMEIKISAVKAELDDRIAALEELQQRYLRLQADFDNYRKRIRREQEEFTKSATAGLIAGLLPVIDNLERALAVAAEADKSTLITGVEMILRQLRESLALEGLALIEAVGQPFNPELHEAVGREETTDEGKINLVLEEYRQGYTLKGKLLRPAMVKVAVAAEPEDQEKLESGE